MTTAEFIHHYLDHDVAEIALRVRQYPDVDAAFALRQIDGYQRARQKLPTLAEQAEWHWPARLSVEQCSSEATARYKAQQVSLLPHHQGVDLTGGLGIDTLFLSEGFEQWHYVEMQEELCQLAAHNMQALARTNIHVYNTTAEDFLRSDDMPARADLIFLDPARRDSHGGKVFRLGDCTPDVTRLYEALISRCDTLMIKLSPMLDVSEALSHLPDASDVHIIAVGGEVKEVLILCHAGLSQTVRITAVNLHADSAPECFVFSREEEAAAVALPADSKAAEACWLYEPNAAILKAGAFKLVAERYGLRKLAPNTHLYVGESRIEGFPGRVFMARVADKEALKQVQQANIICRNYPLKPEELKKKLKIKDGGSGYVIATRLGDKPVIFIAERIC